MNTKNQDIMPQMSEIVERKQSHVDICMNEPIDFDEPNGFEAYRFLHNATPEINLEDIDLSTTFLGQSISFPLMISSMTGGYSGAEFVNRLFAELCQNLRIPIGVGSMRQALEEQTHQTSFAIVRQAAPDIQIFANIGAPEVAKGLTQKELRLLIDIIQASGLIVHLNPAQELFQPEGSTNFKGFLHQLRAVVRQVEIPVIVKEVGSGISAEVAKALVECGVQAIDVAGKGGTSWQKVEEVRYLKRFSQDTRFSPGAMQEFLNWGISTAECLSDIQQLNRETHIFDEVEIVASGGIQHGLDLAKSLALGAQIGAAAKPFLKALLRDPDHAEENLETAIQTWMNDLRAAMFLSGAQNIETLRNKSLKKITR